jgi:hypothetical protein
MWFFTSAADKANENLKTGGEDLVGFMFLFSFSIAKFYRKKIIDLKNAKNK